jgi:hypothetical protein
VGSLYRHGGIGCVEGHEGGPLLVRAGLLLLLRLLLVVSDCGRCMVGLMGRVLGVMVGIVIGRQRVGGGRRSRQEKGGGSGAGAEQREGLLMLMLLVLVVVLLVLWVGQAIGVLGCAVKERLGGGGGYGGGKEGGGCGGGKRVEGRGGGRVARQL